MLATLRLRFIGAALGGSAPTPPRLARAGGRRRRRRVHRMAARVGCEAAAAPHVLPRGLLRQGGGRLAGSGAPASLAQKPGQFVPSRGPWGKSGRVHLASEYGAEGDRVSDRNPNLDQ